MKATEFKHFITDVKKLDYHQRSSLLKALAHQPDECQTLEIIEKHFAEIHCCPRCKGTDLYRHGIVSGLQRYYCKSCKKTFNGLTGTPLARLRQKDKWLTYLDAMLDSSTVRRSATYSGVHRNTSFRWRHRFLKWITQDHPSALHGITEADETYQLESFKGQKHLNRLPRKRGGVASKRGISDEQVCILVARDRSGQILDFVTGNGPISKAKLVNTLKPVLDKDALLISDSNPSYTSFCRAEGLSHKTVNLSKGQRVNGAFHIQNVNAYHSRFKMWLQPFHGVATKYLPNYLGWRRAFEQFKDLTTEKLLHSAIGDFQQLKVS
jgi:transposase-like protein